MFEGDAEVLSRLDHLEGASGTAHTLERARAMVHCVLIDPKESVSSTPHALAR